MKSKYLVLLLILFSWITAIAQTPHDVDSSAQLLAKSKEDTTRVHLLIELATDYSSYKPDSAVFFADQALHLARKLKYTRGECRALNEIGRQLRYQGEYPRALEMHLKALELSRGKLPIEEGGSSMYMGMVYLEIGEYKQALNYLNIAKRLFSNAVVKRGMISTLSAIGEIYAKLNKLDSALWFQEQASNLSLATGLYSQTTLPRLGSVYAAMGKYDMALTQYHNVLNVPSFQNSFALKAVIPYKIAEVHFQLRQFDSSIYYAKRAFVNSKSLSYKTGELEASSLLAKLYKSKNKLDSAYYYQDISMILRDSLFGIAKFQRLQLLAINEQQRQQEIIQQQERYKNNIKWYASLAGLVVFLFVAIVLFRNNRAKQKANAILKSQKIEIEKTLSELTATQAQLIQSEKMASLGELTAGIAHEIQNPLNFVNNFSEVSTELMEEIEVERLKVNGERDEQLETEILNDIKQNLQKINHHGKRADAIVKGMLQHSRKSEGTKESTDINKLVDEYLRLAYQGLRAKDKHFNTELSTHFDERIGKINIVPQDIGRVLLNLYNNAFYAVNERKKTEGNGYKPQVVVQTKREKDCVVITVRDNGSGVPQKLVDKIFQPFFTTKPTGQGTGLGLSLSYDIIKAHGGEIKVESKEGEGSTFTITLPS